MPIYEYQCEECLHVEESLERLNCKFIDCSLCGNRAKRIMSQNRSRNKEADTVQNFTGQIAVEPAKY